jgi:hypothetical protein
MTTATAQPPVAPFPLPPGTLLDRSAAEASRHDPSATVRKGDTVIWAPGGSEAYSDGRLAFVSNVYMGGEGIDLLVPSGSGILEPRNLVNHVSERNDIAENRVRDNGLWMSVAEHHQVLIRDRADREKRKAEQLAMQRKKSGQGFVEAGPIR